MKNKHPHTDEDMEAEQQEVKRLKFSKDEEDEDEEEEDEQEVDTLRPSHVSCLSKEAEAMVQDTEEKEEMNKEASSATAGEDQGMNSG